MVVNHPDVIEYITAGVVGAVDFQSDALPLQQLETLSGNRVVMAAPTPTHAA